jgi:hypothetical protein
VYAIIGYPLRKVKMLKKPKRPRGRPPAGRKQISLKLKPEIEQALENARQAAGLTRSEFVEQAILARLKARGR